MSIINYADDFICCFQYESVAKLFYEELLPNRLKQADLELAEDKTRMLSFGRFAISNCMKKKPDTFEFLGFTHYCGKGQNGKFRVKRKTSSKKFRKKLIEFNDWCRENRNESIETIMITYRKKLIGYYNYYGISDNYHMIRKFYYQSLHILFKWVNRRSQRKSYNWEEFIQMTKDYDIPKPHIKVKIYSI